MWETILGGVLAILGGWGAVWYQTRNARKRRMDELMADRKIEANAQAYSYIKAIQGHLVQSDTETTCNVISGYEEWFFENRLFLPGRFPDKWLTLRNDLFKLRLWEKGTSKTPEFLTKFSSRLDSTVEEAIHEIYNDMGLEPIKPTQSIHVGD